MEKLKKFYSYVCKVEKIIAGSFIVTIMAITFAAGVGRTIGHPINWAMDMSTFLFAWTVFLSADIGMRKDEHVNVEVFINLLPDKYQKAVMIFNYVVIIIFLSIILIYGAQITYETRMRQFQGIPGFSYSWAALSAPVGSLLLIISTCIRIKETYVVDVEDISSLDFEVKEE